MSSRDEVLYGRPQRHVKVFISSEMRSGELSNERAAVAAAISEMGAHRPWWWEKDGVAGEYCAEAMCLGHASTSEFLILILGSTLTDITRKEFLAAKDASATTIIFGPKGCVRDRRAKRFFKEQGDASTYGEYVSIADLKRRVQDSLYSAMVRAVREHQLSRREVSLQGIGLDLRGGDVS
jgi:hypothetical protein